MIETPKNDMRLRDNISRFLNAYSILTPDGRIAFLVALDKAIKNKTDREKKMHITLLKCARDGKNVEEAIGELNKAEKGGK